MKLPEIARPRLEAEVPGLSGKLVYTAFTVADKRNLLSATSFQNPKSFTQIVAQIAGSNSNLKELGAMQPHFIELAFMKVYAASVGGGIEANYTCPAELVPGGEICGATTPIRIQIDDVGIDYGDMPPQAEHIVKLSEEISVVLRVPDWNDSMLDMDPKELSNKYVLACIKSIVTPEAVLTSSDYSEEELKLWLEELPAQEGEKFSAFFQNLPVVQKTMEVTCPKCSAKRLLTLRGVEDFFV